MALRNEELTGRIIAAAIEVHKELGPGFLESIYQNAMEIELDSRGIEFDRLKKVKVLYRGREVGEHELDLFVFDQIVVELKAIRDISDVHFAIVRSYLRAVDRQDGLILNFGRVTLQPRRVEFSPKD